MSSPPKRTPSELQCCGLTIWVAVATVSLISSVCSSCIHGSSVARSDAPSMIVRGLVCSSETDLSLEPGERREGERSMEKERGTESRRKAPVPLAWTNFSIWGDVQ